MIRARRDFFDVGHYRPIARAVAATLAERTPSVVVDAGCGEGFYLGHVAAPHRFGIDISKPAIRLAARRHPDAQFAVGSSFHLPLPDHIADAVVSVFAPRPFEEFARVLRTDGCAVVVSPGPNHLRGLTDLIYRTPDEHEQRPHTTDASAVTYDLALTQPDIIRLVQMTPYWWKATAEQQELLRCVESLSVTVDVIVSVHTDPAEWSNAVMGT
jgi:23S rRNA (guanine745-N1)-methyltransferase